MKSKSKLCDVLQQFIDLEGDGEMRDCPNCYNQYAVDYKACLGCSEVYPQNWRDVSELIDELRSEIKNLKASLEEAGDFIGDKKAITQNCPTCEQLLAEARELEAELAEERRYWK